ncbi:unnamed protein product [Clavelina lepadiformis]|uniref:Sulfotransferase family protein n=1 Tax=Clavelina lepadiformis TaxID=159417 RepID=A0ABP0H000_CLALP
MKVIVASYSKCGTKTMAAALTDLGFVVYDYFDHFQHLEKEWMQIFAGTANNVELFQQMYKTIDAVTDTPSYFFVEDLCKAFPNAKVILTQRDEKVWWDSFLRQSMEWQDSRVFKIILTITPIGRRFFRYLQAYTSYYYGFNIPSPWSMVVDPASVESERVKQDYREHNAKVIKRTPKDKLLIFKLENGWGPLCEFLGVEKPTTLFPHKNVRGKMLKNAFREHPVAIRMQKELMAVFIFAIILLLIPFIF